MLFMEYFDHWSLFAKTHLFSWSLSPNTCLFLLLLPWLLLSLLHRLFLSAHPQTLVSSGSLLIFIVYNFPRSGYTPMLMTFKYIFLLLVVFLNYLFTVQRNSKLNLSKITHLFSLLIPNKTGLPLVFPPSLNGTTGHRVAEVKRLLIFFFFFAYLLDSLSLSLLFLGSTTLLIGPPKYL